MKRPAKQEKPLTIKGSFEETLQRLVNVSPEEIKKEEAKKKKRSKPL
jgi:hypothetical protein